MKNKTATKKKVSKKDSIVKKSKYEKIINLDLWIKTKATSAEWERYDALLVVFGNFVFQNKIGRWGGRETAMGNPKDGLGRTNYWFVLESGASKAVKELTRMVKNFRLEKVTKIQVGIAIESKDDYKKKIEKEKEFCWSYTRI